MDTRAPDYRQFPSISAPENCQTSIIFTFLEICCLLRILGAALSYILLIKQEHPVEEMQ